MIEYLEPDVNFEGFNHGTVVMEGVSTSIAGFIGMATRGPVVGKPVLITSMAQYRNIFGSYLNANNPYRYLSYGVEQFFINGGSACYVMRVASSEDVAAIHVIGNDDAKLIVRAKSPGAWGNECDMYFEKESLLRTNILEVADDEKKIVRVESTRSFEVGDLIEIIGEGTKEYNRILSVREGKIELERAINVSYADGERSPKIYLQRIGCILKVVCDDITESFHFTLNKEATDFIKNVVSKSNLVEADFVLGNDTKETMEAWIKEYVQDTEINGVLKGGKTLIEEDADLFLGVDKGPGKRSGLTAFMEVDNVSIMAIPGVTIPEVQNALIAHCERMQNRFAILDMPKDARSVEDLLRHRSYFDSTYAAVYHSWIQCYDVLNKRNDYFPPSAAIAGIYARVDNLRGVHKAPANEIIRNCTGLSVNYNEAERMKVNSKGINSILALPGQGIRVWGARTCSSDAHWKYINNRRLFIFMEESVRANTKWALVEPNDANLWHRVERTIRELMFTLWREGALCGTSEDEAFFVNIGASTMSQDDILNGRLICEIGAALSRPAEFVNLRIIQKMRESQ